MESPEQDSRQTNDTFRTVFLTVLVLTAAVIANPVFVQPLFGTDGSEVRVSQLQILGAPKR